MPYPLESWSENIENSTMSLYQNSPTSSILSQGRCSGVVFEITGADKIAAALEHLETREQKIGGYDAVIVPVYVDDGSPMMSIMYYATPQNELFMDEYCCRTMAEDIATARGVCGYNCEYLLRCVFLCFELLYFVGYRLKGGCGEGDRSELYTNYIFCLILIESFLILFFGFPCYHCVERWKKIIHRGK